MNNLDTSAWKQNALSDDNAVIIDVRTPMEWSEGVIPDALLLNMMDGHVFTEKVQNMDRSKNYYIYCRSGARSGQACRYMAELGMNCYNLAGGIISWDGEIGEASKEAML